MSEDEMTTEATVNTVVRVWPWPRCAVGACRHEMIRGSSDDAAAWAREHLAEFIDRDGSSVCECHPRREALRVGVMRFNCGNRERGTA